MEHVITLGVSIDDDAIRKNVENQALDAVVEALVAEIKSGLPRRYGSVDWMSLIDDRIDEMLEDGDLKAQIISVAAEELAAKVARTKAWREKYKETAEL